MLDCSLCLECRRYKEYDQTSGAFLSDRRPQQYPPNQQQRIMRLIVNSLEARRERLLNLALTKLPKPVFRSLKLDGTRLLDSDARKEAELLVDAVFKFIYP